MRTLFFVSLLAVSLSGCVREIEQPASIKTEGREKENEPIVIINTKERFLKVMSGEKVILKFPHIALGSSGAGVKRKKGDDITPVGRFSVAWINYKSKFTIFIGLNYPNLDYADRALNERKIDNETYQRIRNATLENKVPPQDTALGGYIGIHGIGRGNPEIHKYFDWTNGCVAVENDEIRKLASLIKPGLTVDIQ